MRLDNVFKKFLTDLAVIRYNRPGTSISEILQEIVDKVEETSTGFSDEAVLKVIEDLKSLRNDCVH